MNKLILTILILLIAVPCWAGQFSVIAKQVANETNFQLQSKIDNIIKIDVNPLIPQNYKNNYIKKRNLYKIKFPKSPLGVLVSIPFPGQPMMFMDESIIQDYDTNAMGTFIFIWGLVSKAIYFSLPPQYFEMNNIIRYASDFVLWGGTGAITFISIGYCW